ncbi:MAG: tetratricopeptide repeat protein [Deltaproteobacteria bacterium]|nr:tetratricopeptide repeat protein [Deltaproteobacteria bacterium]
MPYPRSRLALLRKLTLVLGLAAGATFTVQAVTPSVAEAAKKKKKKATKSTKAKKATVSKEAEEEAAKKTEVAKPAEPKKEDPLKRAGAASFKIETTIDQKEIARTRQADQKRDEAIEELKKLIPKAPSSRKAEMIFRLAELYWEKSKYRYGLEMEEYEKAYQAWVEQGGTGSQPEVKDHIRESELIKQNALKLYAKVLGEYPTYERNDEVLFYLGYNEYEAGNKKKAVNHYWTLIKQFPNSRLVADAYLQLGEHFFGDNNVIKARKAYERALASSEPRIYDYALYKLAWCDYNIQEYAAGIVKLKKVIEKSESNQSKRAVQLKNEALGDLARFFSYVDEVDTAFAYFKKKGGEDIAIRYTTRLGGLFHEQGKWNLEIKSYRLLIDKYPMHDKAPYLQASIVEAFSQMSDRESVRKEVERLVDLYRPGTPWYRAQQSQGEKGKAALEYAYDLTESKLRDLVTDYHRDAQKRKDVPTYELARDIYAKYLDAFSDTESAYQMRFFYAEVLWALEEWRNAAGQYLKVATSKTDGKAQGKYARISAYNQILALEKIVATGEDKGKLDRTKKIDEKKEKGGTDAKTVTKIKLAGLDKEKSYNEEPIPEIEQQLSDACDLYFKIADPKDNELPAIKFKAAYLYFKHNHFVSAAERYFEIIDRWPGDDLSKKAANLVLDSLNVQKKWDELAFYAEKFRDNDKLAKGDKKFKDEVQTLLEGASYLSVQTAEKSARDLKDDAAKQEALGKVAARFASFQERFPSSQYADKALYSAVLIYNQADELDRGIEAAELMKKEYKKSDLTQKNDLLLATFYERIADFETAADLYLYYYKTYTKDEQAPNALFNAGIYYLGLGRYDDAIKQFEKYTKEFSKQADVADVAWRICELQELKEDWKKVASCFDDYQKSYKKASQAKIFESRYRYALAQEKLNNKKGAVKEYQWLVKEYPKLDKKDQEADGARLAGAHAAFELLEPEYVGFEKLKVTLNKKSLLAKLNKAEELACVDSGEAKCKTPGKFLSILTYGNGDYGICALTRMGQVYREVADSIRNAPLPPRLDEDQIEIYKAELDNVALGPEEKGLQAFESALSKAYELNIYNKCTLTAQDNLKELNPNKFPDLQKRNFKGAEGFIVADIRSAAEATFAAPTPAPANDEATPGATDDKDAGGAGAGAVSEGAAGAAE